MGDWIIGKKAVKRIIPIASRFVDLNKGAQEQVIGLAFPSYIPWLTVPAPKLQIESILAKLPEANDGPLLTDANLLCAIRDLLREPGGGHAVARIVPTDIGVEVDVEFGSTFPEGCNDLRLARRALTEAMPWLGALFDALIVYVVPIIHRHGGIAIKRGFSSPRTFGAVFLTFEDRNRDDPWHIAQLAIDLAHEVGHHVLYAYQSADPILTSDLEQPVYSGVRKIARPAIMSLHANVALAYMIAAGRGLLKNVDPASEIAAWLRQQIFERIDNQRRSLADLLAKCTFTELGIAILQDLVEQIESN